MGSISIRHACDVLKRDIYVTYLRIGYLAKILTDLQKHTILSMAN